MPSVTGEIFHANEKEILNFDKKIELKKEFEISKLGDGESLQHRFGKITGFVAKTQFI